MLRLDIGCGKSKPNGFVGVDRYPATGVDIVADLNQQFPFPDNSVDELRAHDIIEHLLDKIHTMNEIWRVCKPSAKVDIRVPSTDGRGAFQDPTHVSFWNINSFFYYCVDFPPYLELCKNYGFLGSFKILKLEHEESLDRVIHVRAELGIVKSKVQLSDTQTISPEATKQVTTKTLVDKDSGFTGQLSICVEQYQQNQNNLATIANLRQARKQVATQLLCLSANQVEKAYLGELGKAHKILLNSCIRNEPLVDNEKALVAELSARISKIVEQPEVFQHLLAIMLYCDAAQLLSFQVQYNVEYILKWLLNEHLKYILEPPKLFQKMGEVDNYYQYMRRVIDYLHTYIVRKPNSAIWHNLATEFSQISNFISLYFNEANLKDIYVKRAEIIEQVLKMNGCKVDYEFENRPVNRKKTRLGILATHFTPAAETFASLPVYEYISRDFEVILYCLNRTGHPLEQYCQSCANSFKLLPKELVDQVDLIRADDLDILFIATNITAVANQICLLSLHRLARMQVTSVASVVTTGMRHIDYYISGQLTEPLAEAEQQYREKLVKLDGTAHCFSYGFEQKKATVKVERESLGISEKTIIFISSANFFKITPELVDTWARIIVAVSNSVLVLLPFGPNWSSAYPKKVFLNHLNAIFSRHGVAVNRLIILDPQPVPNREDVREYFKIANVYLDSYPFSGTTSLIEPLEVGLPIVSRQGNTFRSSMGAAILQELDVPDLVADSEESYIQLAIALGTNPELRQQKSDQIKEKMQGNPRFLDSRAYSAQLGTVFQELFHQHQAIALKENFKLRDINLIIFPDWSQPEDLLFQDLTGLIRAVLNHPGKDQITLLADTSNISDEDANLVFSSVVMDLLLEEDLDATYGGAEISLLGKLSETQWEALIPCVHARIVLENENTQAIASAGANNIPISELNHFSSKQLVQLENGSWSLQSALAISN